MKLTLTALACVCWLSAVAADYEWSSITVPLVAPETQTPLSGLTAYLVDADILGQQQILSSVIGEGQPLADYLKSQGGAALANATVQEGLIDHTAFNPPSMGTDGHAYFVAYSETLRALYFSGYSSITPDGFGQATLVSNASSSRLPINYTTIFQGSMTAGDGGGWYAVPEPTSGILLLLGCALMALKRKRSEDKTMKKIKCLAITFLTLAGLSCLADEPEEPVIPSYKWRATAGGIVPPGETEQLASGTVYLFDANKCSETNALELLRGGTPISGLSYVIGKQLTDGLLPTGDAFGYGGEEVGQEWNAYMVVATDTHVFFSNRRPAYGVCLGWTDIVFDSQAENSTNVYAKTDAFAGPGWYAADLKKAVSLDPGSGVLEATVAAADATAATNRVTVLSVDTTIVSDADYAKYFRLVATPQSEGVYLVRAELDAEKIDFDKSVNSFAAKLAEIAASGETTVTVTIECKPGLCYRVKAASAVTGTYEPGTKTDPAPGNEVEIDVPKPTAGQGFYKLEVSTERPTK